MFSDPALLEVSREVAGEGIVLRLLREEDAPAVFEAVQESRAHLLPWLPWGDSHPTVHHSEAFIRRVLAAWLRRETLTYGIFSPEGRYHGGIDLHAIDWSVPRMEIGYWVRAWDGRRGIATAATRTITGLAFTLGAERVSILVAEGNAASTRVAEAAGYELEGILKAERRDAEGTLRDMRVYALDRAGYERL